MARIAGKPNQKKYKRMTLERHIYLSLMRLTMMSGKSFKQARKIVTALLKP